MAAGIVRDEEQGSQEAETEADAKGDRNNVPRRLLIKAQIWRALVNNRESADGTGDEEKEGGGVDGPRYGISAHVNQQLDEHEDDGTEATGDEGGHAEAGEDGTETGTLGPTPLHLVGADGGDTNTGDGRDERVG